MDMYGNTIDLELVIHPSKEVNKVVSDNKNLWQEIEEFMYVLEAETNIVINSIMVAGTKTPLDTVPIALQNKRENIDSKLSRQEVSAILLLNKGKKLQA